MEGGRHRLSGREGRWEGEGVKSKSKKDER